MTPGPAQLVEIISDFTASRGLRRNPLRKGGYGGNLGFPLFVGRRGPSRRRAPPYPAEPSGERRGSAASEQRGRRRPSDSEVGEQRIGGAEITAAGAREQRDRRRNVRDLDSRTTRERLDEDET